MSTCIFCCSHKSCLDAIELVKRSKPTPASHAPLQSSLYEVNNQNSAAAAAVMANLSFANSFTNHVRVAVVSQISRVCDASSHRL